MKIVSLVELIDDFAGLKNIWISPFKFLQDFKVLK
jgi:hypothetical protein